MTETNAGRPPLYKKVTDQLREQCLARSGEMLPSLRQLSQQLEVNHATISRALRDLEQEGIVEIVPRKGIFAVARPAATANFELVVLVGQRTNLLDVAAHILDGMEAECQLLTREKLTRSSRTSGQPPFTATRCVLSDENLPTPDRFVAELRSRGTVGIVLLGFGFQTGEASAAEDEWITQIAAKIPLVLAGSPHATLPLDCVYGDPRAQLREFLEACYARGERRFEYLGDFGDNLLQRERRQEFTDFMARKELPWKWDQLRWEETAPLAAQLRAIDETNFPQVVVATNVKRALTVTLEAQSRGLRLPEALQVLCFASVLEHAQPLLPYISVVLIDEPGVGRNAVQLLNERLAGNSTDVAQKQGDEAITLVRRVPAHFLSGPMPFDLSPDGLREAIISGAFASQIVKSEAAVVAA